MNTELKSLISTLFVGEQLVSDVAAGKSYFALLSDAIALLGVLPADVSGFPDLLIEMQALSNPINSADLVAYVQKRFAIIEVLSTDKAENIVSAIIHLIGSAIEVEQAFA